MLILNRKVFVSGFHIQPAVRFTSSVVFFLGCRPLSRGPMPKSASLMAATASHSAEPADTRQKLDMPMEASSLETHFVNSMSKEASVYMISLGRAQISNCCYSIFQDG